ncbi:MAG TPA: MFS transporter [Candidatus Dormibacteraeota bacterium]|nr:MFS transporter [Candidatus Dormibacteraeota bacterium]
MGQTVAPLRHPGFRLLLLGQLTSNVGDMVYAVALPWYVLADHGGVLLLGTVLTAYGVPRTVCIALGGHASDRWRPWVVMLSADAARAVAVIVLAAAAIVGPPNPWALIPIALVLGVGEGLFLPGSFSIIPVLLPDADLQAGNALASSGTQLATVVGPAIGGVLVGFLGPGPAFGLDGASFAVSALTLAGIWNQRRRVPRRREVLAATGGLEPLAVPLPVTEAGAASAAGISPPTLLQMLLSERVLQIIMLINVFANLGLGALSEVALPDLAHGPFHAGAGGYGALLAVFGAGALIGTLSAAQAGRPRRPALIGSWAFLVECLFMSLIPFLGGSFGAGAALVVYGGLNGFGNIMTITAFQRWAPPELLGRLMGLLLLTSFGVFPVSVALGALGVHHFGPSPIFPLAGAVSGAAILFALSQRRWREFGATTAGAEAEPKPL